MKKLFVFAGCILLMVALTACSLKKSEPTVVIEAELEAVGRMQSPLGDSVYVTDSVRVLAKLSKEDTTLTLTVNNVKFVPQQPMSLTFSLPGVKYYQMEQNIISFAADSVVPVMGVVPMPTYMARRVQGQITADSLKFSSTFAGKYSCAYAGKLVKTTQD